MYPSKDSTCVGSGLECYYQTRVGMTDIDDHTSLLLYGTNCGYELIETGTCVMCAACYIQNS